MVCFFHHCCSRQVQNLKYIPLNWGLSALCPKIGPAQFVQLTWLNGGTAPEVHINNLVTIITGPESGFSEKELAELTNVKEIKMRYLGENVLRAETAPIVVSSVIKNHFGRI